MEPEVQTDTIQPDDPITLLRRLLVDIDGDARVIDRSEETIWCGWITRKGQSVEPSHVVVDAEGEIIGWGISEADAITSAIRRAYKATETVLDRYQKTVWAYREARAALDNL